MDQKYTSCRAVIIKDGRIMLIHRFNKGEEFWVFPGGHFEAGETFKQALRREISEELSLEVTGIGESFPYSHPSGTKEIFVYCQVSDGQPILGGPEKKVHSPEDWYDPGWVDLKFAVMLDKLYPIPVRDALREKYANH